MGEDLGGIIGMGQGEASYDRTTLGPGEFAVIVPQLGGEFTAHIILGGKQQPGEYFSERPPPFAYALAVADRMVETRKAIVAGEPGGVDALPTVVTLILAY
jgi:hypothetical protein